MYDVLLYCTQHVPRFVYRDQFCLVPAAQLYQDRSVCGSAVFSFSSVHPSVSLVVHWCSTSHILTSRLGTWVTPMCKALWQRRVQQWGWESCQTLLITLSEQTLQCQTAPQLFVFLRINSKVTKLSQLIALCKNSWIRQWHSLLVQLTGLSVVDASWVLRSSLS